MTEKLYRVWNKTRQEYQRPTTSGSKFYANETGAKLGIRRLRDFRQFKGDEWEIHEWIAIPVEEYNTIATLKTTFRRFLYVFFGDSDQSPYAHSLLEWEDGRGRGIGWIYKRICRLLNIQEEDNDSH